MSKTVQRPPKKKPNNTPSVGIFFVVGSALLIETTPLSRAGIYGEFKIHEPGHDQYWELLISKGSVPQSSEYGEYPRGRVAYNQGTDRFSLCLLTLGWI
jgi:hypothetical protein